MGEVDDPRGSDALMATAAVTPRSGDVESSDTLASGQSPAPETPVVRAGRRSTEVVRIGRFAIERKLGAGGMGVVFLAEDTELKRKVVIKLLRDELAGDGRTRLLREAQAMAKVSHPNVVPVFDVGLHEDRVFIAMEFIDGGDLAAWLRERHGVREVLDVFVAAGRGLAAAHKAGLVHRDFKPNNVLISKAGDVKVTDFGLARAELVEAEPASAAAADPNQLLDTPLTQAGALVGTPAYMAPEQIRAQPVDARSDQFSFCIACYEAVYGERPFIGKTAQELFDSTLDGKLPETMASDRRVPRHVRDALRRGLKVEPGERFPSMDALLTALSPPARRAPLVIGAIACVALAGAGVLVFARGHTAAHEPMCDGDDLAAVWNTARRTKLETAFVTTGAPLAKNAFATLAGDVERYAKAWRGAYREACEATRVRGVQSEAMMERQMRCLRRGRGELDAVLDVASSPDDALMRNAAALTTRLTTPAECANVEGTDDGPSDPKMRAEADAVEAGVAKFHALVGAARVDAAKAMASDLVSRATASGSKPTLAAVDVELAKLAMNTLEWAEAEQHLNDALELAEQAGADRLRATAYILLVEVATYEGKLPDGQRWARQARAAIERMGQDKQMLAELGEFTGDLEMKRGDIKASEAAYLHALERYRAISNGDSHDVARVHQQLANLYVSVTDFDRAFQELAHARDAYVALEAKPELAGVLDGMSAVRLQQDRNAEALELADRELEVVRGYFGDDDFNVADAYTGQARALGKLGRQDEAIAKLEHALVLKTKALGPENPSTLDTQANLGLVYDAGKRYDDAYATFARLVEAYDRIHGGEPNDDSETYVKMLGTVRKHQGRYADALVQYERARGLLAKIQGETTPLYGDILTRIGAVHVAAKHAADAIAPLERAVTILANAKAPAAYTKLQLAYALWDANRDRARARAVMREAKTEAEATGDSEVQTDAGAWLAAHP